MAHLSILGSGNMGQAITAVADKGGHDKLSWTGGFGIVA